MLERLPPELALRTLSFVDDAKSRFISSPQVCKAWHKLANDEQGIQKSVEVRFPDHKKEDIRPLYESRNVTNVFTSSFVRDAQHMQRITGVAPSLSRPGKAKIDMAGAMVAMPDKFKNQPPGWRGVYFRMDALELIRHQEKSQHNSLFTGMDVASSIAEVITTAPHHLAALVGSFVGSIMGARAVTRYVQRQQRP